MFNFIKINMYIVTFYIENMKMIVIIYFYQTYTSPNLLISFCFKVQTSNNLY